MFDAKTAITAFAIMLGGLTLATLGDEPTHQPERYYQMLWAEANQPCKTEVTFEDRSRADIVTETHAIEVDFAKKYGEAVKQCLHYADQSGKRAGIVLIVLDDRDQARLASLLGFIERFAMPIDVWSIDGEGTIKLAQEGAADDE